MNPASEAYLKRIVRDAVHETLDHIGFSIGQPQSLQADMIYLRKARLGSDELTKWVRRTVVCVAVTGLLYAMYDAIRIALRS